MKLTGEYVCRREGFLHYVILLEVINNNSKGYMQLSKIPSRVLADPDNADACQLILCTAVKEARSKGLL
jgi:hypothetical protein